MYKVLSNFADTHLARYERTVLNKNLYAIILIKQSTNAINNTIAICMSISLLIA
jgi:hypothetical protein